MSVFEQDMQALYFGSMPVEHIFLTEYMPAARGDYVKVYLMCLYHSRLPGDEAKVEDISRELGLEMPMVENALRYWERRGLLVVIAGDTPRYQMRSAIQRALTGEPLTADNAFVQFSENVYSLFGESRKVRPSEISMAYEWVEEEGLSPDAVLALLRHMWTLRGPQFNFQLAGQLAVKLRESGIRDAADAESYLAYEETVHRGAQAVLRRLGRRRMPSEDELALYRKWTGDWGYTQDAVYREYEVSERQHRAIDLFVPDMMLTEAQLDEYYETQFLAPDRERYSENIPLYEREILSANNASFYTPKGYRNIRQILLEYPESVETALKPFTARMKTSAESVGKAYVALADAAVKAEDWSELDAPRAEYDRAVEALEKTGRALADERKRLMMPLIQDTLDAIDERLDAGIDFKSLIAKYSADVSEKNVTGAGYPLHPDSEGWPEEFIVAGMALEKPGDISEPVLTDRGVHILYYDSDLPSGDHVLTDDERQTLAGSALYYYQTQALIEMFEEWKPDYDIEIHPEMLTY